MAPRLAKRDERLRLLGGLGRALEAAAWLIALLYTLPIAVALALFWPPGGAPPFSLPRVLAWTIGQAAASASIAVALGWPLGVLAGFYWLPAARAAVAASLAPFMSPVAAVALGLRAVYGEGGLLGEKAPMLHALAEGWTGVLALHSYFNIGLAAAMTAAAAGSTERSVVEHARVLGLRGPRLWLRVLIPLTRRAAAYAWSLAFLYSFTSAAPLLVQGAAYRYYTLEAWLYTLYRGFPGLIGLVPVLALAELALAALAAWLVLRLSRGLVSSPLAARGEGVLELRGAWRLLALAYVAVLLGYLYAPVAGLALQALDADPGRLLAYAERGPGLLGAVANSLLYAAASTTLALVLGLTAAEGGLAVAALSLIAVAPVAYGVAASLAYYRPLAGLLGGDTASRLLILLAHTAAGLPLASRVMAEAWARLQREVGDTMLLLGLRGARLIRHLLAATAPLTVLAAGLAAAASLGEFGASIVVSIPSTWSLTVLVYNMLGSGRFFHEACLAALILEAMSLAAIGLAATAAKYIARARA
ncbi:putative ABC-type iron(III) transport system, permease component [Pyrodictium delaneyi]|uniref:Putative ABC-type iron(III) transport system, permease component n=1 Tax=Pyrodictium delaneyi TaxID=1273541 RepID=A0A0P0N1Q5_9CREN|nr:hypothetical protein [Pyrodictium delaneyi]ALL00347.1 putative ABC-type iron(III) transport system, permease component [Pyrodictium delaneyi]OWJ54403.1 hypothetical protein Pdsh_08015 [Pyrodictium delaneyi]